MTLKRHLALGIGCVIVLSGCAQLTSKPVASAPPPAAHAPTPAAPAPPKPHAASPVAGTIDSIPSPAAESVLARIPEPLTAAQQALAPKPDSGRGVRAMAPAEAYDTLRTSVPVPAETQPLGTSQSTVTLDTSTPPASPAPAATTSPPAAAPAAAAGTAAATPDDKGPCWRLQVAAPTEKDKADVKLEAAQSLLVVPMAITIEKGYFKVRTRDCMTREAADAMKQRAIESGFEGSFLVDTNAAPAAPKPAQKHAVVPKSKRKT